MTALFTRDDRPDDKRLYFYIRDIRNNRRYRVAGFESMQATKEKQRQLERLRDCARAGIVPPDDTLRWLETQTSDELQHYTKLGLIKPEIAATRQPLRKFVDEWIDDKNANNKDAHYVRQARQHVLDFIVDSGCAYWSDLTPERIRNVLDARAEKNNSSPRTYNARLVSLKTFVHWCNDTGRGVGNPTARIKKRDESIDRRRNRRPLPFEHLNRLVDAAMASTEVVFNPAEYNGP